MRAIAASGATLHCRCIDRAQGALLQVAQCQVHPAPATKSYRLHPLKGRAKNRWSIEVSGNWRLTFKFKDGNAYVLDYEDYH